MAIELLSPRSGERILDAGCGTGRALAVVSEAADCSLTGIDPAPTMVASARRKLGSKAQIFCTRVEELATPVMPYDGILALNVLYFASADGTMTRALFRQLVPGGRLVVYVTHRATMAHWPFVGAGLHRLYDEEGLVAALVGGGFARESISVQLCHVGAGARGILARAVR